MNKQEEEYQELYGRPTRAQALATLQGVISIAMQIAKRAPKRFRGLATLVDSSHVEAIRDLLDQAGINFRDDPWGEP